MKRLIRSKPRAASHSAVEKANLAIKKLPNIVPKKVAQMMKVDLKNAVWMLDPIQSYIMTLKMQKMPVFAEAVNRNMTGIYFKFLDYKVETKENITLEWKGTQRSGKTTGAISTHKYIATKTLVPFTVDDVLPNEQYYPDAVKYAKPHQSIIIDEQKEQQTGLGSFRIMQHTEDLNNIVAKLCLNISWVHPPEFVGRGGFYGLETCGRDFEHKLTRFLLYDLTQKMFGISSIPLGFVIIPKYRDQVFEDKYEKKKDVGIDAIRNEDVAVVQQQRLDEGFALAKSKLFQKVKNNHQKIQIARKLFPMRTEGEYMELVSIANMNMKLHIQQLDFDKAKEQVDKDLKEIKQARNG